MGILNVTPDSFSDGGRFEAVDDAIAWGLQLREDGADIVDVGGESTRPGAARVEPSLERQRIRPVVAALVSEGVRVSVDTMRAETAAAAIEVGASLVNDVSGGLADPAMAGVVADAGVDYVAMHWRAHSERMDDRDVYADVVAEVRDELEARVAALTGAGIDAARIILDPGLGFSKVGDSNWPLLANLGAIMGLGHRVIVGASRKRFLGGVIVRDDGPLARDDATTAVTTLVADAGAWAVRVHDARAAHDALGVVSAWHDARRGGG
jgi:dihydropteroate synthase